MNIWMRRLVGWPPGHDPGDEARRAERLPRVGREFLLLQFDGLVHRAAHVRRRNHELELLGSERGDFEACLAFLLSRCRSGRNAPERVVLVTSEARPALLAKPFARMDRLGDEACEPSPAGGFDLPRERFLTPRFRADMAPTARSRWARSLAAHDLDLVAVYPLAGSPLGALEEGLDSALFVQVEHELIVVAELVHGRCVQLELHPGAEPTPRRVQELVGEACPEVLLCGGGAELSVLGYELARTGSTWVRLLHASSPRLPEPALAALVGAARLASGLAPVHRQAFLPCQLSLDRGPQSLD